MAQYARYVLNGSDDELLPCVNNDAEKLGKLRELCKAMLSYGAKAQIQFNYPTDDPADAGLQYTLEDVGELGATTFPEGFKDACGIQYAGSSLVLETKTTYRLYFNVTDQSLLEGLTVKLGNETLTPVNKGSYVCYDHRHSRGESAQRLYADLRRADRHRESRRVHPQSACHQQRNAAAGGEGSVLVRQSSADLFRRSIILTGANLQAPVNPFGG